MRWLLPFLLAAAAAAAGQVRVNAGGPGYTDAAGNRWAADSGFHGGGTYATAAPIAGAPDQQLYQSEHYCAGCTLEYSTAVPNGSYNVTLKFAEIFFTGPGQRVFNIVINGQQVESKFDPFAAAGGMNAAVDKTYPVAVSGGNIDIQFVSVTQNPKVSAIDIEPVSVTITADDLVSMKMQLASLVARVKALEAAASQTPAKPAQ